MHNGLILRLLCTTALLLASSGAEAYEFLLDIDLDDDPTTINEITHEPTTAVRLVLAPTEPGELFAGATFGLGGSCIECNLVQQYGTAHDLIGADWMADWTEVADLVGWAAGATHLGCFDSTSYHLLLTVEPVDDFYLLSEPVFIATFDAWQANPVPPGCQQPPSNLATMHGQGGSKLWNYIQIGGPAVETSFSSWTTLKSNYR
jgi:hypothetical protein